MASTSLFLATHVFFLLLATVAADYPSPLTLTVVNNCPFTIWPAIQPNSGNEILEGGGFELPTLAYHSFLAPEGPWSGRIWARTGCYTGPDGAFSCETGDCGGQLACAGLGGTVPATLAQLALHQEGSPDKASYGVSLVDGFNLPLTVTPHEGSGECPEVGCRKRLLKWCPQPLTVRTEGWHGRVVGCKSGCAAFDTDDLCCRGAYSSPGTCRPSSYSEYFKEACPATYTYAQDVPSVSPDCAAPEEIKFIFCY